MSPVPLCFNSAAVFFCIDPNQHAVSATFHFDVTKRLHALVTNIASRSKKTTISRQRRVTLLLRHCYMLLVFTRARKKVLPRCNPVTSRAEKSAWRSGKTHDFAHTLTLHCNITATLARRSSSQLIARQHIDSHWLLLHLPRAADFFLCKSTLTSSTSKNCVFLEENHHFPLRECKSTLTSLLHPSILPFRKLFSLQALHRMPPRTLQAWSLMP